MVALVDHLEEAGLVERRPDPEDRRVRGLYLTRKGRAVLERAGKIAIDYETRLCAGINREEREQLIDLLQKLQESQTHLRGVHPGLGESRPMAKLLIHLATGPENPTRGALALLVARTAVDEGHDVQVFLAGDGVQYARPATASTVQGIGTGSFGEHWEALVDRRRADLPVGHVEQRARPRAGRGRRGRRDGAAHEARRARHLGRLDADLLIARLPVGDDPDVDAGQPAQEPVGQRLGEAPRCPGAAVAGR